MEPNNSVGSIKAPNVAVVGSGYWGQNLVRNFYALGALRLVCDRDEHVLAAMRSQYNGVESTSSFAQTMNNAAIRAVVIATPAVHHASMVREALLADKDERRPG
ncbi:MAG: hypothetical protein A3J49_08835 [Gallionellales bacterium RIFCSPHIGHO2_02_FULL_57_16]|nr:MAG: hypothetical protein A3J49_08835 [Gallionellales bacterium RIFCSPHIGHO2_02_FULL_57_16]